MTLTRRFCRTIAERITRTEDSETGYIIKLKAIYDREGTSYISEDEDICFSPLAGAKIFEKPEEAIYWLQQNYHLVGGVGISPTVCKVKLVSYEKEEFSLPPFAEVCNA